MADTTHPMAAHHVPFFITPPGETDSLLVAMGIFLVLLIVGLGVLYFRLHALPEQISHRGNNKTQFEIVAVLALLALFTHNNMFWVAALLLAMVPIPDFLSPLNAMVSELGRIARGETRASPPEAAPEPPVIVEPEGPAPVPGQGV
jgi:phosphatidylglycerophosphate synthase